MKANDFYIIEPLKDRKPQIIQRLLYIPKFFFNHEEYNKITYFENSNDVHIEYCSGNGEWIIQKAIDNPSINYIAVEMRFDRAKKIFSKMHNLKIQNLFVVMSEAFIFTKHYLKDDFINEVFINFPDPWPKRRHEKNRLVNESFIQEMQRVLNKNSVINIVTDDENYLNQILDLFLKNSNFKPLYEKPFFVQNLDGFGTSFFNELFKKKKININHLKFIKIY